VKCEDRDRLLSEYNSAVLDASKAASNLIELAGTAAQDDYALLLREEQRASTRARAARRAYEEHITRHGCSGGSVGGQKQKAPTNVN
jgi:hypothetical protein